MGLVSIVVIERGGKWPGQVGDSEPPEVVGGAEQVLAESVRTRINALQRAGQRIRIAVLACSEALNPAAREARAELAHQLLSTVATQPFGRLVLSAPDDAPPSLRIELMTLVATLSERLTGTTATVTLRFGDPQGAREPLSTPAPADASRGMRLRAS